MISSNLNGTVSGLAFRDEDIITYDPASNNWSLLFDGSDVGLGNVDIDGFSFRNSQILISLDSDFTLNNFGPVDDSDILAFTPTSLGATTAGRYSMFFDGSDVGLSSSGEDIDAIDFDKDGNLLISVNGSFSAPGPGGSTVRGNDEDVFALTNGAFGTTTSGVWSLYFDGSAIGMTNSSEDLQALWIDHTQQKLYFATINDYVLTGGLAGNEDDIVTCTYTSLGATTTCALDRYWNGQDHGFGASAIDSLSIGTVSLTSNGQAAAVAPDDSTAQQPIDDTVEYPGDDADDLEELDGMEEDINRDNKLFMPRVIH